MNLRGTRTPPPPCFSMEVEVFLHRGENWPQKQISFTPNAAVWFVDVAIQPFALHRKTKFAYENREQRQSRFGPIPRIYALLDDRFDELPNQTENKSLDSC
ncbi:hypothetical protein TNCV_1397771 [Trichonephila clavipes]|nr:hypothetical protein TNCV_1397771 [Trichonephila clavipes]